jgi:hypothetical protein
MRRKIKITGRGSVKKITPREAKKDNVKFINIGTIENKIEMNGKFCEGKVKKGKWKLFNRGFKDYSKK